ncbi:EGF-like domain protein [Trichinella nativa]|uniref:Delta-like protein n=1 Tax=Trichinella nativa TaxID=6335 RepID=A0A1Y3EBB9_9BILA|nr:EGF-like domain protein [Trichinella nativa]
MASVLLKVYSCETIYFSELCFEKRKHPKPSQQLAALCYKGGPCGDQSASTSRPLSNRFSLSSKRIDLVEKRASILHSVPGSVRMLSSVRQISLIALLLLACSGSTYAVGRIEMALDAVYNPKGQLSNGAHCRDRYMINESVAVPGLCHTIAIICYRTYDDQERLGTVEVGKCHYGQWSSHGELGLNSFGDPDDLLKPLISNRQDFTYKWPVTFSIFAIVHHWDHQNAGTFIYSTIYKAFVPCSPCGSSLVSVASFLFLSRPIDMIYMHAYIMYIYAEVYVCRLRILLDTTPHAALLFMCLRGSLTIVVKLIHGGPTVDRQQLIFESVKPMLLVASSDQGWTRVDDYGQVGVDGSVGLTYRIRVVCADHHYGPDCAKRCSPKEGYYNCSAEGERICMPGWLPPKCQMPICLPGCTSTCRRPGTCDLCPQGWTGPTCGQCEVRQGCVNGYCNKPNECICHERWGGVHCDIGKSLYSQLLQSFFLLWMKFILILPSDLDLCFHRNPCQNGATCLGRTQGNFTCLCASGFTGTYCNITKVNSSNEANSCKYNGIVYQAQQRWLVDDCAICECSNGTVHCNRELCNPNDCLTVTHSNGQHSACPAGQLCKAIYPSPSSCLKAPCSLLPFGQCWPVELIERQQSIEDRRKLCDFDHRGLKTSQQFCSRIFLRLNISTLDKNTYVEQLCSTFWLQLSKLGFARFHTQCKVYNTQSFPVVSVDLVSLTATPAFELKSHLLLLIGKRPLLFTAMNHTDGEMEVDEHNDINNKENNHNYKRAPQQTTTFLGSKQAVTDKQDVYSEAVHNFLSVVLPAATVLLFVFLLISWTVWRKLKKLNQLHKRSSGPANTTKCTIVGSMPITKSAGSQLDVLYNELRPQPSWTRQKRPFDDNSRHCWTMASRSSSPRIGRLYSKGCTTGVYSDPVVQEELESPPHYDEVVGNGKDGRRTRPIFQFDVGI